jgi:hypothetical protein
MLAALAAAAVGVVLEVAIDVGTEFCSKMGLLLRRQLCQRVIPKTGQLDGSGAQVGPAAGG